MTFKVYKLVDPRDGQVHYIGRTNGVLVDRLAEHVFEVSTRTTSGTKSTKRKKKWLLELLKLNLTPKIVLIASYKIKATAIEQEFRHSMLYTMRGDVLFSNTIKIGGLSLSKLIKDLPYYTNHALSKRYNIDKKTVKKIRYSKSL